VGYTVYGEDGSTLVPRSTSGVIALGNGVYGADITVPAGASGTVYWDTYAGSPVHAIERIDLSATVKLGADGLDAVVIEAGLNARQILALMGAALAGTVEVDGSDVIVRSAGGVIIRITSSSVGGRSGVVLNPPA
jgi:hypothetical protein